AAADQAGELVKRDRVLLGNQEQKLKITLGDPEGLARRTALITLPVPSPGCRSQFSHLHGWLSVHSFRLASPLPLAQFGFAPAVRDHPHVLHRRCGWVVTNETPQAARAGAQSQSRSVERERGRFPAPAGRTDATAARARSLPARLPRRPSRPH